MTPDAPATPATPGPADDGALQDGRVARGQRSRQAFVDAFLALVGRGHLAATGAEVAEAAGLSVRSLFTHFADLDALYDAAALDLWQRYVASHRTVSATGSLEGRVERWVEQRAVELEELSPYADAAALREPFSPALRASRARFVAAVVADVEVVFAPELAEADDAAARRDAVAAASTYMCWNVWRRDLRLDLAGARAAMARTVLGALR